MGKKLNPTLIGAFVLGAVALAVAGVVVFGSGQFFKHMDHFVMFFPGSVNGLSIGAPVKFKGVDIGAVNEIQLVLERQPGKNQKLRIPVYVQIDPSKIMVDNTHLEMTDPKNVEGLIDRGMRGQLQAQSLVTGLLFVQIDFFPDTPIKYVLQQPSNPLEIPTVPTTLEQAQTAALEIIDKLRAINFEPMVQDARDALSGIKTLVNSPALHSAIDRLPSTVDDLKVTVASLHQLSDELRGQVKPLSTRLNSTLTGADQALTTVRETASTARVLIAPGSPLDHDLRAALRDVSNAAQALAQLADFLERNPTALLYGKPQSSPPEKR